MLWLGVHTQRSGNVHFIAATTTTTTTPRRWRSMQRMRPSVYIHHTIHSPFHVSALKALPAHAPCPFRCGTPITHHCLEHLVYLSECTEAAAAAAAARVRSMALHTNTEPFARARARATLRHNSQAYVCIWYMCICCTGKAHNAHNVRPRQ